MQRTLKIDLNSQQRNEEQVKEMQLWLTTNQKQQIFSIIFITFYRILSRQEQRANSKNIVKIVSKNLRIKSSKLMIN